MLLDSPLSAFLAAFVLYYLLKWYRLRKIMPPGPLGLPLIGNKYQLPAIKPWKKFKEWNDMYGPVTSLFLGGTPVIVLGKAQPAWDLLEKRSDIYSSRPRAVVGGEILSDNKRGLMLPNNDHWRKWRKMLHSGLHAKQAETYNHIQSLESKMFMKQMLDDPNDYERNLQRFAGSIATTIAYGRRVNSVDEWILHEQMDKVAYLVSVNIPGKYLVESWPWLLKLPRSFQWFRSEPEKRRQSDSDFLTHLYDEVREKMRKGTAHECLASRCITDKEKIGLTDLDLAYAVSSPFGAGIETTAGTVSSFILAMLHFPEVQKKAQAELDSVVGRDRMPDFEDRDQLPYIRAVVNESLRWRPVPILGGSPHAVTSDDVYDGMFIPKGSTIFANFHGIMKDEDMFPNAESFIPERFLETDHPRLRNFDLPFGFGRRICPGMHLALNSLYILISRILWEFHILPELDNQGKAIIPDSTNYTNGFNSRPVKFPCRFIPRTSKIVNVVNAEWDTSRPELEQWE